MKLSSTILIVFVLSAAYLYPQECTGRLHIRSEPDSAVIFINSAQAGKGMIDTLLDSGAYTVFVSLQPEVYNASSVHDTIIIRCDESIEKKYNLQNGILVRTAPDNAALYVDDSLTGYTPLYINIFQGDAELRKDGYRSLAIPVKDLRSRGVVELENIVSRQSESFIQTNLFKILVGGILISGGAAAYFKLKADDTFDDYRNTGARDLLQQTDRYDLISGISFGILQINFGLLIYNFLIE